MSDLVTGLLQKTFAIKSFLIFVPFEVGSGGADAHNIRLAITIEINNGTGRGSDSSFIEIVPSPTQTILIFSFINEKTATVTAISGNNLVVTIVVQIRSAKGMSLCERIINDMTGPFPLLCLINDNLVAMPRLNAAKKAVTAKLPHNHIARAAFGPRSGIAACDLSASPVSV